MLINQQLKAIFFDLDNVLVFSERLHFNAWQQVMKALGECPNTLKFEDLVGIDDVTQSRLLKKRFSFKEEPSYIFELKRKTFLDIAIMGFESAVGRDPLLEKISECYRTAVVSSSSKSIVEHVLKIENIKQYFDFIIAFEDCERHKPDPMPYQMALEKANVLPHEALVIEDSVAGIRAAQAANIPVIGLLSEQLPEQIVKNVQYFNHFEEVLHWLLQFRSLQDQGSA